MCDVTVESIPIRTIPGHMTCITTNATDDVGGEVALFGAVKFSVTYLTAILASLVLIIAESPVERCKLTKLVTLELILAFGYGSGLYMLEEVQTMTGE